jgi:hypothetical protein
MPTETHSRPGRLSRLDKVELALAAVALVVGIVLAITVDVGLGALVLSGYLMLWIIVDQIRTAT